MVIKDKYVSTKDLIMNILTVLLCAAIVGALTYVILYTFKVVPYYEYVAPIIIIICIVLMIVCAVFRRKSQKTLSHVVLVINLVCLAGELYFFPVALQKNSTDYNDLEIYLEAKEDASIETVIRQMYAHDALVHNTQTEKINYEYIDEEKIIANKFGSLDFTFVSEGFYYSKSNYFFMVDKYVIYFNYSCTGITVHKYGTKHYSDNKTTNEFVNSYSISNESATELKALIDNTISNKIIALHNNYSAGLEKMGIEDTVDYLDGRDYKNHRVYFKEDINDEARDGVDINHAITTALKSSNFAAEATKSETVLSTNYNEWNIFYSDCDVYGWCFRYIHEKRCFRVEKDLFLPETGRTTVKEDYIVSEEWGEYLMKLVKENMSTSYYL